MKQSEKLEIVGCTLGILAIFTLAQSSLLNTIAIIMGFRMLFRLRTIYKKNPTVAGIYVSSDKRVYVSDSEDAQSTPFQVQNVKSSSTDYESFVRDVFACIRKGYGKFHRPEFFFCPSLGAPSLSPDFFRAQASRLGIGIYSADPRMCAASGANVNVTDFSKQVVIVVSNDAVYSYLVFAACIFHGESVPVPSNGEWHEILERQISRLKAIVEHDLPPHFKSLNLDAKEYQQILEGWLGPCGEIHLIGPPDTVATVKRLGLKIATTSGVDDCVASGLSVMIKGFSQLPPGSRFEQKA